VRHRGVRLIKHVAQRAFVYFRYFELSVYFVHMPTSIQERWDGIVIFWQLVGKSHVVFAKNKNYSFNRGAQATSLHPYIGKGWDEVCS
jgi:hypothetical protein